MSYTVNDAEFRNVMTLSASRRYSYFLKKIVYFEEIWSVGDDEGWSLMATYEGTEAIPFWPARRFAEAVCTENWVAQHPKSIDLHSFVVNWLPGMAAENRLAAVFPTVENQGVVVEAGKLLEDVRDESSIYDDEE